MTEGTATARAMWVLLAAMGLGGCRGEAAAFAGTGRDARLTGTLLEGVLELPVAPDGSVRRFRRK